MASTQNQTIADAVTHDHREMWAYYDEYVRNAGNVDAQTRWANQLTWEIARHSIGEELVMYPMFEDKLGEKGKLMAAQDRQDHQYVKDRLYKLERMTPGSEEHTALLKDVIDHLKEHATKEEREDLPALTSALSSNQSLSAGKSFMRTKKFVPTRSHPSAPNKPPFETLAGMLAAPMDKLKDAFGKFPSAEELESVTARTASQVPTIN
ncbi:hypothetical protein AN958_08943 [Leucoagaricus sp. SymC.cos]|nr:hypothetical protein AN958_08943 [Leucoagaricus sp. SymC.cos]